VRSRAERQSPGTRNFTGGVSREVLTLVGKCLAQDSYETYLYKSEDFRPVKQDKDWALAAFQRAAHALDDEPSWGHGFRSMAASASSSLNFGVRL